MKTFLRFLLILALSSSSTWARTFEPRKVQKTALQIQRGGNLLESKTNKAVGISLLLALNSGFINGCTLSGFLGTKQATAAVTGSWTNSAIGFASGSDAFASQVKMILSYMTGSFIASLYNPEPAQFEFSNITFKPSLLTAAILLAGAHKMAKDGNTNFLVLCAIANGINNSVTSVLTGNLCRTAHFSGITSDIGTFLGQVLRGNSANLMKLKVFSLLALCFWVGGALSYFAVKDNGANALIFPTVVYSVIGSGLLHKILGAGFETTTLPPPTTTLPPTQPQPQTQWEVHVTASTENEPEEIVDKTA